MTKKYAKVEGHPNLLRDLDTNAIVNTDSISANNYDKSLNARKSQKLQLQSLQEDIETLKDSIDEIKNLLRGISNEPR
jgi:hypothetical protein